MVKRLREQYGQESRLLFSVDAYEGTHLAAYGLIEMVWRHTVSATILRRLVIKPDGGRLTFEPVSI